MCSPAAPSCGRRSILPCWTAEPGSAPCPPAHHPAAGVRPACTASKYREHDYVHNPARLTRNEHRAPRTAAGRPPPGSAGVSPAFQRTAGAAAPRVRLLAAHGSAAVSPWSAGVSPAFQRTAPGSRRSRACRARRRGVAARRHAAETTIADPARRDDAATRLRRDGKRGDGEPARSSFLVPRSSFLVPRSSFLAAVFLMSAPAVQDRVHESLALSTA
jgi:hypothetical protein